MKKLLFFITSFLALSTTVFSQWTLKLRSSVELMTYQLTNKVDEMDNKLQGASIILYKGTTIVSQMQSDANGSFIIEIPPNGDFILVVSYPGCNAKKFSISTIGVPEELSNDKFLPSFGIEGVIMAKPYPTIDYSILQQPLAKISYKSSIKNFASLSDYTNQMLASLASMRDAEGILFQKFTSLNNAGDVALAKGDCQLAKTNYENALAIIPGERYPIDQLLKVGNCIKDKELAEKKAADQAAEKLAAKALADKLIADKANKLAQEKAEAEKLAQEKQLADKLAKEKQLADKLASDKLAQEKAAAEKLAQEKQLADKLAKEKQLADKLASDKLAAEKLAQEKSAAEKLAQEKQLADKLAKEKQLAEKLALENAKKEKLAAEKTAANKLAAEKAINEKPKEQLVDIKPIKADIETKNEKKGSSEAKYNIPQKLGSNTYIEAIKRGDELFKMKRFAEAKVVFEEALKQKPNDAYSSSKLADIEKLTLKK